MTKKDYEKIARCLHNYYKKWEEMQNSADGFDEVQYLIDEFCYMLEEENPKFQEKKFRQAVLNN